MVPALQGIMNQQDTEKLLYHILRFNTTSYGIESNNGWVNIDNLIYKVNFQHGDDILDRMLIYKIIKNNKKFSINFMKTKIKANHVEGEQQMVLKKAIPPDMLYFKTNRKITTHGKFVITPEKEEKFLSLSTSPMANNNNIVVEVDSRQMFAAGYVFYISDTGDFMTEKINSKFVKNVRSFNNGD